MNIYVPTRCVSYYVDSILCGLNNTGNQILLGDNIYKERSQIDAVLIDNSPLTNDLVKYIKEKSLPVILINRTNNPPVIDAKYKFSPVPQDGYTLLPSFANTSRYQPALPSEELSSSILLVTTNVEDAELANRTYNKLFDIEGQVKIVGQIHAFSVGFVGLVNNQELMAYGKSAKVVLVEDEIIRNSMLFYSICARPMSDADQPILSGAERDKYVRGKKIQLVTENKIAEIINEKLGNSN